ncbi:MAG: ABC transporter ATP-binding protein [Acidimicrobiales bacterium]
MLGRVSAGGTMASPSILSRGLRLIVGYVRTQRRPFALAVAGTTVYAAAAVGSTVVLGRATDEVLVPAFDEGARVNPWWAAAAVVAMAVLRSAGVVARRYYAGLTAARARADLQRAVIGRLLAMPLDRIRSRPRGELLAHLDTDAEAATEAIHPLPFAVGAVTMVGIGITSLALVDVPLMLISSLLLPLIAITSWLHARVIHEPAASERHRNGAMAATADEILDGLLVVKTLGREHAETTRFAEVVDRHRSARVRLMVLRSLFERSLQMAPELGAIAVLAVGVQRVDAGALTTGELVQAVAVFGVLAFPLAVIGFFLTDLPASVVAHERIARLLDEPDDPLLHPDGRTPLPPGPLGVTIKGLVVNDRLRVGHLRIHPGETLAIVGPTGGGKSTLLEVVCRLRPVEDGRVEIGGVALAEIDPSDLRRRVALATQEASLFAGTVLENTAFSRPVDVREVEACLTTAGADDLLSMLPHGYETVIGERGVTLSGGQRQRVAVARALVGEPGLLALDDATSAVDPGIEEGILGRLAARPTTVVIVTHRVAAMAAADRVVLVDDGRIVAVAPHRDLLTDARYRSLVEAYRSSEVLA